MSVREAPQACPPCHRQSHRPHEFDTFLAPPSSFDNPCNVLETSLGKIDNDTLDAVDHLERTVAAVLQRLGSLAPATIKNGVGGGDAGGGGCILASHDADENADRGPGVAACKRSNFNKSLGHAR